MSVVPPPLPQPPAQPQPAAAAAKAAPQPAPAPAPSIEPVALHLLAPDDQVWGVLAADHRDPFGFLGMHAVTPGGQLVVRAFLPHARSVAVIETASGRGIGTLDRLREEGFFAGPVIGRGQPFAYRLRVEDETGTRDIDDPYRFPPLLADRDVAMLADGNHLRSYDILGAHPMTVDGVDGVGFAVWAPNAGRVSVIGSFNSWDGRCHGMRLRHDCGVWEIFVPAVKPGELYKYEIKTTAGVRLTDKCDPYANQLEPWPGSAAIVCDARDHAWGDRAWMERRKGFNPRERAIAIYEVHPGSWRRKPEEENRCLTYDELADELVSYVDYMGFTHIELMPVGEFDVDASLGFLPFVPFAPTNRWGTPDGFARLVDRCHQAGIGVILDWVPNRFSEDPHGLRSFDGTDLFEHADPQQRRHPGSSGLIYDYGRREVSNFLLSNARYWFDRFHADALRISQLPTMLYLDYGRSRGEWTPNRFGGHENLEAVDFIRRFNEQIYGDFPGAFTVAEDASAWARVSHPTFIGGLGFGFKWFGPWTRDTLRYMSRNPVHRKYYHDELTHGPSTAFQENYILPLSHDDVATGRGSLLRRMPGDRWQRFANLRAYYALMYAHPGKKLLFMGDEFAQEREWNSAISLDWHVTSDPLHHGVQDLIRDLNGVYRSMPALYQLDCDADGFAWIDCNDSDQSVISFLRRSRDDKGTAIVICNLTPVVRQGYRIGVPHPGAYLERLNTDAERYGGVGALNGGAVSANPQPMHGRPYSIDVTLPPFGVIILEHRPS